MLSLGSVRHSSKLLNLRRGSWEPLISSPSIRSSRTWNWRLKLERGQSCGDIYVWSRGGPGAHISYGRTPLENTKAPKSNYEEPVLFQHMCPTGLGSYILAVHVGGGLIGSGKCFSVAISKLSKASTVISEESISII